MQSDNEPMFVGIGKGKMPNFTASKFHVWINVGLREAACTCYEWAELDGGCYHHGRLWMDCTCIQSAHRCYDVQCLCCCSEVTLAGLPRLFVVVLDAGNDTERFYDWMYWFITVGFCEAVNFESKHTVIKLVLRTRPRTILLMFSIYTSERPADLCLQI